MNNANSKELYRLAEGMAASTWLRCPHNSRYDLCDLKQEAYLALLEAQNSFNPSIKVPLRAHVATHINYALSSFIVSETTDLSVSTTTMRTAIKAKNVSNRLSTKYKRAVSDEELAKALHVRPATARNYRTLMEKSVSMSVKMGDDDDSAELGDFCGTYDDDPIMMSELGDFYKKALDIIKSRLTPTQRYIFTHSVGIGCRRQPVKEIAANVNLSANKVYEYMHPSSTGGFEGSIIDTILSLFEDNGITYAEFEKMLAD